MNSTETDLVEVARFVRLVQDLTSDALNASEIDELPIRDRPYVQRLRILAAEDHQIIQRQRVVWLKLQQRIPLLESEAKELLEVLGCRGFYFSGLNVDGMVFSTLDLSGGMIVGDYSCQYTRVRGSCDERNLVVVGRYSTQGRRLEGGLTTGGLRVLGHRAASRPPAGRDSLRTGALSRLQELRSNGLVSVHPASDEAGIEELSEDDIINSCAPPPELPSRDRSGHPLFPPPPSSTGSLRRSLAPRVGSSRCSRPPRASASQRALARFSTLPLSRPPEEASPDTKEIDVAWE